MANATTIGIDFGTHQSKVCIETVPEVNIKDRFYSFYEFETPKGEKTLFLPSVVQVNNDRTLSYGFVDEKKALITGVGRPCEEPIFQPPKEPVYETIPKEPSHRLLSYEEFIKNKSKKERYTIDSRTRTRIDHGVELYEKYLEIAKDQRLKKRIEWEREKKRIEVSNKKCSEDYQRNYATALKEYERKRDYWKNNLVHQIAVYRYFKIAAFTKENNWTAPYSPKLLSTWYLTYLLFELFDNVSYSPKIAFQMGIPQSVGDDDYSQIQIEEAEDIFYEAMRLYRYYSRKKHFLSKTIDELLATTKFERDHKAEGPQVLVLPEAYAALLAVTNQEKVSGMNILVDIGGGSTDISFFNVKKQSSNSKPNISQVISLHKGLNYIYSLYREAHFELTVEQVRELFTKNRKPFENSIKRFQEELEIIIKDKIYNPLWGYATSNGITLSQLKPAITDRKVVYSGGGSVYKELNRGLFVFTEPISASEELLSREHVSNKRITRQEWPLLAVAFGLAKPEPREPQMTPLHELLRGIVDNDALKAPRIDRDDTDD